MPDLHLTGVHEDDVHLLLSSADGTTYRLPIDDALRAAVRRGPAHAAHGGSREPLRPVDVQAMIRAGATAHEAAERAGWPVEKVHRYEGPILAERSHVAGLAGGAHLRGRSGHTVTLLDRVTGRLKQRGVDPDEADWDAWRSQDGQWTVDISFSAGGRRRTASWHFSRSSMTVTPVDDESRWLGEDDTTEPAPARREVVARHDVYDVENDRRERRRVEPPDPDSEIMTSLRERAAARTHRRRTPRRLASSNPGDLGNPEKPASIENPENPENYEKWPNPENITATESLVELASPATEVGFTSASPTDVPAPTTDLPDDAVPLEPHGYDPDTMAAPPAAHAEPDAGGPDGRPEPAAESFADSGPQRPAPRRRARTTTGKTRRVTAPPTHEPEPEIIAEPAGASTVSLSGTSTGVAPATHEDAADAPMSVAPVEVPVERPAERTRSVAADTVDEPELPLDAEVRPSGAAEAGVADESAAEESAAVEIRRRDHDAAHHDGAATDVAFPEEEKSDRTATTAAAETTEPTSPPPKPTPPAQKRPAAKRGRASVPAWDDVMFGAKPER